MVDLSKNKNSDDIIKRLFEAKGLGVVEPPIIPVSGGFMHKMYKVCAGGKCYAVKHLNREIMKRPEARKNYEKAEKLESILEENKIPIIPAISINNTKMFELEGEYFYIFNWQEGSVTDWNAITLEQCRKAGSIQGRIHAIDSHSSGRVEQETESIDFSTMIEKAKAQNSEIFQALNENVSLLEYALEQMNSARKCLPGIECIIDEDMDPKNVMWLNDEPVVIDLECLDYGNPVSSAIQLSLQWAGITTCSLDIQKMKAFFKGYLGAYDNGFDKYTEVFGLAYTWVEWLEFNIERALGNCVDENERQLGISEVNNTVARIKYIREVEDEVKYILKSIGGTVL